MKTRDQVKQEIESLSNYLKGESLKYYLGEDCISDAEFDREIEHLSNLESLFPEFVLQDSPTKVIGHEGHIDSGKKRKHPFPNLSLAKAKRDGDGDWFIKNVKKYNCKINVEPKIDGASMTLYYSGGALKRALSRGDGFFGEDITDFALNRCKNVPSKIKFTGSVAVRGEVCISNSTFSMIVKSKHSVKNPRNLSVGLMKRDSDSAIEKEFGKVCEFIAHQLEPLSELSKDFFREAYVLNHDFSEFVFAPVQPADLSSINEVGMAMYKDMFKTFDFNTDGLVLKILDYNVREELGDNGMAPKWAIAWKFDAEEAVTELLKVDWQVGRTGRLTPVAILKPVELGGTTVSRASLHNIDIINSLEVAPGDLVVISKRGEIIPQVERIEEKRSYEMVLIPEVCPSCGKPLEDDRCVSKPGKCVQKTIAKLSFFAAKGNADIESVSGQTVSVLVKNFEFRTPIDFYTFNYWRLLEVEGFAKNSIEKIISEVKKSQSLPFWQILAACGFSRTGHRTSKKIYDNGIRNFSSLLAADEITLVNKSSVVTGQTLYDELNEAYEYVKDMDLFFDFNHIEEKKDVPKDGPLNGMIFALTGDFVDYRPRKKLLEKIFEYGGSGEEGITSKTTHLVIGGERMSSKVKKAADKGVKILTINDLEKMINN